MQTVVYVEGMFDCFTNVFTRLAVIVDMFLKGINSATRAASRPKWQDLPLVNTWWVIPLHISPQKPKQRAVFG